MNKEERQKIRKKVTILAIVLLVMALGLLILVGFTRNLSSVWFNVIIIGFLAAYWILLDVVEPRLLHEFEGKTDVQKSAYYKYAGADLAGYAGVAYFVLNMGNAGSSGLIGAIVYVLCMGLKRKFRDQFIGEVPSGENGKEEPLQEALETEETEEQSEQDSSKADAQLESQENPQDQT